jgi:hypothetical protein
LAFDPFAVHQVDSFFNAVTITTDGGSADRPGRFLPDVRVRFGCTFAERFPPKLSRHFFGLVIAPIFHSLPVLVVPTQHTR